MSYTEIILWSTYAVLSYIAFPLWMRFLQRFANEIANDDERLYLTMVWLVSPIALPLSIVIFLIQFMLDTGFKKAFSRLGEFLFLPREDNVQ